MLRDALAPLWTAATICLLSLAALDSACLFYREYEAVATKLQGESWLREKCQDPFFFSNMTSHTDICLRVEADYRVGAVFLALNHVTESHAAALDSRLTRVYEAVRTLSWPFLAALGVACVLCPALVARSLSTPHEHVLPYKHA